MAFSSRTTLFDAPAPRPPLVRPTVVLLLVAATAWAGPGGHNDVGFRDESLGRAMAEFWPGRG